MHTPFRLLRIIIITFVMSCSVGRLYADNPQANLWTWFISNFSCFNSGTATYGLQHHYITLNPDTDLQSFAEVMLGLAKNDACDGILVIIDNNGGSSAHYSVIYDLMCRIKKIKPIVGLVTGNAYSVGYLVASAVDYLFAHSLSGVGNIGVYQEVQRWADVSIKQDSYEALAKMYVFRSGKYKGLTNPCVGDLSEDEKTYLQNQVEKVYQELVAMIAQSRGLDIAQADKWADGKDFIASEALALGLIDEIGTIFEAEAKLVELMKAFKMQNALQRTRSNKRLI